MIDLAIDICKRVLISMEFTEIAQINRNRSQWMKPKSVECNRSLQTKNNNYIHQRLSFDLFDLFFFPSMRHHRNRFFQQNRKTMSWTKAQVEILEVFNLSLVWFAITFVCPYVWWGFYFRCHIIICIQSNTHLYVQLCIRRDSVFFFFFSPLNLCERAYRYVQGC